MSSSTSGSIAVEIADHLPVSTISYDPTLSPFQDTIEIRDFKRFDRTAFQKTLRNANGTAVYVSSDENESLTRFLHTFDRISNNHAPLKSINVKRNSNKPWVTLGLRKSIKVRDKLCKKWLTTSKTCYLNQ